MDFYADDEPTVNSNDELTVAASSNVPRRQITTPSFVVLILISALPVRSYYFHPPKPGRMALRELETAQSSYGRE